MTGLLTDGVRLALVLGHAGVDVLDDIRADRGREDLGEDLGGTGGLAIGADNRDGRSGGHRVQGGVGSEKSQGGRGQRESSEEIQTAKNTDGDEEESLGIKIVSDCLPPELAAGLVVCRCEKFETSCDPN